MSVNDCLDFGPCSDHVFGAAISNLHAQLMLDFEEVAASFLVGFRRSDISGVLWQRLDCVLHLAVEVPLLPVVGEVGERALCFSTPHYLEVFQLDVVAEINNLVLHVDVWLLSPVKEV